MRRKCFSFQLSLGAVFALVVFSLVSIAQAVQGIANLRATVALVINVSLDLDEVPLRMAVESLAQKAGVSVTWDEAAMAEMDLPGEETISVQTRQKLPLHRALCLVLEPLHLAFEDQGDSIYITSRQRWDQRVVKASYKVDDIVTDQFTLEMLAETMEEILTNDGAAGVWQKEDSSQPGYMAIASGTLEVTHRREVHQELDWWLKSFRSGDRR